MNDRPVAGRFLVVAVTVGSWFGPPVRAESPPDFEADVLPILVGRCGRCHGGEVRKADLDVTSLGGILRGGESGPALAPGRPLDSPLLARIASGEMPPEGEGTLSAAERAIVESWVARGVEGAAQAPPGEHDVLPILLAHCTKCHGRTRQEGGLDLRSREAILRGGTSGPVVVPGRPEESRLMTRIARGEMPPPASLVEASVKPLDAVRLDRLRAWIAAGAPRGAVTPDEPDGSPDRIVTDAERSYWAFRAPVRPEVPRIAHAERVRNPIDAFLLGKLEARGLSFAAEAPRSVLLRRATIDLTGLPPTPEEVAAFEADTAPDAWERVVDRLLASPRYGERQARHWLDLAGYADTEGKREQDLPRPHAWRFRDYVIRAFETDKPFDRFLTEQLAGDELAAWDAAAGIPPEIEQNLVATGFLRMAPDATWANITGFLDDRVAVIADEIQVLGSAVMGLTLECARCHGHKFDPIPQRDYYRLAAVFKGALDEHDWLKPRVAPGRGPVSADTAPDRLLPCADPAEQAAWQAAGAPPDARPSIQALWDRGEPSPTYVYRRGDPGSPGALVGPAPPSVLTDGKTPFAVEPPWPGAKSTGRRLAFAKWLVRPDHPLTARVAVNRLWKQRFGTGIVRTLGNFGAAGAAPSHPELLDWLACEFIAGGWSWKRLDRLLLTSAAYRQSSAIDPDRERLDPDGTLLSRMPLSRLDADSLYDGLLLVAGRLDERRFGPADAVESRPDGLVEAKGSDAGWRRLIYVTQGRKFPMLHADLFDQPQMNPNCVERRTSMVAPQALHLMNNSMVTRLAESFAARVAREAGADTDARLARAWAVAYGAPPTPGEQATARAAFDRLESAWKASGAEGPTASAKALADHCHALMNSARFLFVD